MNYILSLESDIYPHDRDLIKIIRNIENEIRGFLKGTTYGEEIKGFIHVIRVFHNPFLKIIRQFNRKDKSLAVSSDLDPENYLDADENQMKEIVAQSLLSAIKELESMQMKPKNFDRAKFYNTIYEFFLRNNWISDIKE